MIELIEYLLLIKEPAETYEKSHCTVSYLYYVNEEYLAIRVADPKGQQLRIQRPGVGEGARNMKSMWLPLVVIFFMTYLYRAGGGGVAPSAPPGSATGQGGHASGSVKIGQDTDFLIR